MGTICQLVLDQKLHPMEVINLSQDEQKYSTYLVVFLMPRYANNFHLVSSLSAWSYSSENSPNETIDRYWRHHFMETSGWWM